MKLKYIAICLVLLCCFMGTASAADDISEDVISDSVDDTFSVDEVSDDAVDSAIAEDTPFFDDAISEEINEDINGLRTGGTQVNASTWAELSSYASSTTNYEITLNGTSYNPGNNIITFHNSATIIGTEGSYFTGGKSTKIPFQCSDSSLSITFQNVTFKNMNTQMLIQFAGTSTLENCNFTNIKTGTLRNSVVYNTYGFMNIIDCNFTNCTTSYGVISNYNSGSVENVRMNVSNCNFINNSASVEPGAINNCGYLNVTDSTFSGNHANWWAGSIHTHSGAYTKIVGSIFSGNTAGWNGGALYTYSKLEVYNSTFTDNNCTTNNGGGAIGAISSGSTYNITIENCTFTDNNNLCGEFTNESTQTLGRGGAISVVDGGYLDVHNSTFVHNAAVIGQAICAYNAQYNESTGDPHLQIYNNIFENHTVTTNDTVFISKNDADYVFDNNTFINSPQTHYDGTGNVYDDSRGLVSKSKNVLGDSGDSSFNEIHLDITNPVQITEFLNELDQNTIVYLDAITYEYISVGNNNGVSIFLVGSGDGTVIGDDNYPTSIDEEGYAGIQKFINMTILGEIFNNFIPEEEGYVEFINCNFKGHAINIGSTNPSDVEVYEAYGFNPCITNFINCTFSDFNDLTASYIISSKCYQSNFYNCTFKNINADSLINTTAAYGVEDLDAGISIMCCTFENCDVKGIVQGTNLQFVDIVNCTYDFDATIDQIGNYINATELKIVPLNSVVNISSSEKGVVVIALTDNSSAPIAGATVKYTVNGGDEQTDVTGEDGKITITGLTGEVTIAVTYDGNESFNPISGSQFFNFTEEPAANDTNGSIDTPVAPTKVATKLTAPKVTATYNVAKKLVITLKDANGKVLANKKVTVKVGTISKTLNTNAKGQVSLNVATLVPKTYTATVKFAGDDSYIASSLSPKVVVSKAKPQIVAKAKTFKVKTKTKKYTVTLKNNKGKVLKKVKLTLKVGKKTYKATTNSKGKATFKITKLTKKGKNTATIKFAGSKYYKALSKKVKITVKK